MRVKLDLGTLEGSLSIPVHYNYFINSAIYRVLSSDYAMFLHETGYKLGKRSFKLFTFSRMLGSFKRFSDKITFSGKVALLISSPIPRFLKEIVSGFLRKGYIDLNGSRAQIRGFEFLESPTISDSVMIRTLSPITIYSTLRKEDGRRKTYYYNPREKEFSILITENARKKHFILKGRNVKGNLHIEPLRCKENLVI